MAKHTVMISYSQLDQPIAEKVLFALRHRNISCWVGFENIKPGESWPAVITEAINDCDYFILILTPNSNNSRQVERELAQADSQNKKLYCFQTTDFSVSSGIKYFFTSIQVLHAFKYGFEKAVEMMVNDISPVPLNELSPAQPQQTPYEKQKPRLPKVVIEELPRSNNTRTSARKWVTGVIALFVIIIVFILIKNAGSGNSGNNHSYEKEKESATPVDYENSRADSTAKK